MKYNSYQYGVTNEHLEENEIEMNLINVSTQFVSYGHFRVLAEFEKENETIKIERITTDTHFIDAWRDGMNDLFEPEGWFEDWNDVVKTLFIIIFKQ